MSRKPKLAWLVFDCHDPEMLGQFWAAVMGTKVGGRKGPFVWLKPTNGITMVFQHVPEPKFDKNRVHADLVVPDLRAFVRKVEHLGGKRVPGYERGGYLVMADPEGNEFCALPEGDLGMDARGNVHYAHPY